MEDIFKEIVHILHHDYAGWKDKEGWDDPAYFLQKLKKTSELNNDSFTNLVKEYLLDFNDQHILFYDLKAAKENPGDRGFRVRRYEDRLYITEIKTEKRLKKGMFFKTLGGFTIPELKERHNRMLNENHAERENWTPILSLYSSGEVEDVSGNVLKIDFQHYEKGEYKPVYSVKNLEQSTLLMTMTDFCDPDAIRKMVEENQELINSTDNWIIDVRVNYGGSDASYYCLLPYLMPEEGAELADKEERMLFNCTAANAERQLAGLSEQIKKTQDEQSQVFLTAWKRKWEKNCGNGFVEFDFAEFIPDTFVKGFPYPKSVIVMTDVFCGSAGDSFVEHCKKSSKVTVIGRPTKGLNDYANLAVKRWEQGFELWYPTSRLSRIDHGLGMTGKGIEPHILIPWTPKHIEIDVDMQAALNLLEKKKFTK
ncbi:S41 family peptidase [Heyndrickxia sp. MSNUG]|uniref:S41 family peptidase n=1 Tax=Heyndrickxia sp. MSNUG TaxID=3136677 RepID=UPI003C309FEF